MQQLTKVSLAGAYYPQCLGASNSCCWISLLPLSLLLQVMEPCVKTMT